MVASIHKVQVLGFITVTETQVMLPLVKVKNVVHDG